MNTVVPRFIFCLFFLIGLSVALVSECSDSGTLTESDFTFTYSRDGDYVYITASVETDTWVAIGFSEDELMVTIPSVVAIVNFCFYSLTLLILH